MTIAFRLAFTDSIGSAFRPRGAAGRWNSRGVIVVYTAEHPALAAMELLTAWDDHEDLSRYYLHRCEISADAIVDALPAVAAGLDARDKRAAQRYGDVWVASLESVALRVPSVVVPASYNYLLNPDHPDFELAVKRETLGRFRYDERIVKLVKSAKQ